MSEEQTSASPAPEDNAHVDKDTAGTELLEKPVASPAVVEPSTVAAQLKESSDSSSSSSSSDDDSSKSADVLVVNESDFAPAVGNVDIGELPPLELEEKAEELKEDDDKKSESIREEVEEAVEKAVTSFSVSPERDSEEEAQNRSDKEDTISVKSSSSSQAESINNETEQKVENETEQNSAVPVVMLHEQTKVEEPTVNKVEETTISALQSKVEETNEELKSYQKRVEELRQQVEQYEAERAKMQRHEEENSRLLHQLEEQKSALALANQKEVDLGSQLRSLNEEKEEQRRKNEEEVSELQTKLAEMKATFDQAETDLSEKNGVQTLKAHAGVGTSRTSSASLRSVANRGRKTSKVCILL